MIMSNLIKTIIENTGPKGSFIINYCENNSVYESVESKLNDDLALGIIESIDFNSKYIINAIKLNTLIELTWFTHTPVSHISFYGATIDDINEQVISYLNNER